MKEFPVLNKTSFLALVMFAGLCTSILFVETATAREYAPLFPENELGAPNANMPGADEEMSPEMFREMAKEMFPGMDEAKLEETVQQALAIEEHLNQLTPEERAEEERKMTQELIETMGIDLPEEPTPAPAPAPIPAEVTPKAPEAATVKTPTEKRNANLEADAKKAINQLINQLEDFKTKTAPLVIKPSSRITNPGDWKELRTNIDETLSYLKIVASNDKAITGICSDEFSSILTKIKQASTALKQPINTIETADTMGLQKVVNESGELVFAQETTTTDKVASQKALKKTIDLLKDLLEQYRLSWNLKRVIEKIVPEKLKEAPKKEVAPSQGYKPSSGAYRDDSYGSGGRAPSYGDYGSAYYGDRGFDGGNRAYGHSAGTGDSGSSKGNLGSYPSKPATTPQTPTKNAKEKNAPGEEQGKDSQISADKANVVNEKIDQKLQKLAAKIKDLNEKVAKSNIINSLAAYQPAEKNQRPPCSHALRGELKEIQLAHLGEMEKITQAILEETKKLPRNAQPDKLKKLIDLWENQDLQSFLVTCAHTATRDKIKEYQIASLANKNASNDAPCIAETLLAAREISKTYQHVVQKFQDLVPEEQKSPQEELKQLFTAVINKLNDPAATILAGLAEQQAELQRASAQQNPNEPVAPQIFYDTILKNELDELGVLVKKTQARSQAINKAIEKQQKNVQRKTHQEIIKEVCPLFLQEPLPEFLQIQDTPKALLRSPGRSPETKGIIELFTQTQATAGELTKIMEQWCPKPAAKKAAPKTVVPTSSSSAPQKAD